MSSAAPYVRYIINTFYSLFLLLLYPVRETLARPPDWLILQFHTAPGVAPILLLCRLLQLRHRQQFPSPFQQGPKLPRPPPRAGTRSYDHCPSCPPSTPPAAADHAFAVSSPLFQLGAQPGGHRGLGPLTRILMSKCYACKDTAASCCVLARPPGARASVPCSPVLFSCFFSPPSSCFIRSLSRIVSAPARRKNGVPHQLLLRPSLPFP